MTLLSQPESENTGGEKLELKLETDNLDRFKAEYCKFYHRNPRISQYTIGNPHKY